MILILEPNIDLIEVEDIDNFFISKGRYGFPVGYNTDTWYIIKI